LSEWYLSFFNGLFADLWRQAVPDQETDREVAFLVEWLDVDEGDHLLDVPCGHGRHTVRLAEAGFRITGIDLSDTLLEVAKDSVGDLPVTLLKADMRDIPANDPFNGAYCLGNSLAMLDRTELAVFFTGLAVSMVPGARLVLDSALTAESLLPALEERIWMPVGDTLMLVEQSYDAAEGRLDATYTVVCDGRQESRPAVHWIITTAELRSILHFAGFDTVVVMGDYDGSPFALGDEQVVIVAERRA